MTPISTSRSQSQRLIDGGVDPKTADMHYEGYSPVPFCLKPHRESHIPSWSLSALLVMIYKVTDTYGEWLDIESRRDGFRLTYHTFDNEWQFFADGSELIECAVKAIEHLHSYGYKFNEIEK